jgi:hypothetical protein
MVYLLTLAIVSLVFGLLLIFTPKLLVNVGNVANSVVLYLDDKLQSIKAAVGILLVLVAAWLIFVVTKYPELSYLNALWLISLGFGLLFLFFANWLTWLSNVSNKVVFSTDDVVIGARKIIGVVLVIASVYMFYGAYVIR